MNELDFLAWLILGGCVALLLLPLCFRALRKIYLSSIFLTALIAWLALASEWAFDRVIG